MSSLRGALNRPILAIVLLASLSRLHAETPLLTTDWIAGPGSKVADLPPYVWLNDGTAILDDGTFADDSYTPVPVLVGAGHQLQAAPPAS